MLALRARRKEASPAGPTALVIAPTRELAAQTGRVLDQLTRGMHATGGVLARASRAALAGLDVLVATPLILAKALQKGKV